MSTPDFRQPDPAAALKGALKAHAKVTDALREAATETRPQEESETVPQPSRKQTQEQTK